MTEFEQLISLAKQARIHVSALAKKIDFDKNLQGLCGIASQHLMTMAFAKGLKPLIVWGKFQTAEWPDGTPVCDFHCWLEFENHIIDITATQFGLKEKIYVTKVGSDYRYTRILAGDKAIRSFSSWHKDQQYAFQKKQLTKIIHKLEMKAQSANL